MSLHITFKIQTLSVMPFIALLITHDFIKSSINGHVKAAAFATQLFCWSRTDLYQTPTSWRHTHRTTGELIFHSKIPIKMVPCRGPLKNSDEVATEGRVATSSAPTTVVSRREMLTAVSSTMAAATVLTSSTKASASSEIDKKSGEMFVPKKSMLGGGGSDETRGVPLRDRATTRSKDLSRSKGEPIQTLYETRFIAYLTRFLFNFDPAAKAWWENSDKSLIRFAEFAESVEGKEFISNFRANMNPTLKICIIFMYALT